MRTRRTSRRSTARECLWTRPRRSRGTTSPPRRARTRSSPQPVSGALDELLAGGAVTRRVRVAAAGGSRPGARAAGCGRRPPDQAAELLVALAGFAPLAQQLRVHGAEHPAVPAVRHGDLDLHQARNVDDDAVERLVFPDERDQLAFVKGPHRPQPTLDDGSSDRYHLTP